ncbi:hypothetical protein BKA67DRAFT_560448 [Truncatella angustata]|uniref:Uncharacterized protein n=1 Tax=Truncatella angustata TaxID=152316 RepID=A0A9P8UNS2_9PEZI|nr:uncharacterized protein BKA67DRAFT_560448 [Truncatella angustata]KAH6655361.1 hypothetical protein BKA67DRAFT_560448 [Truncatella angustata]
MRAMPTLALYPMSSRPAFPTISTCRHGSTMPLLPPPSTARMPSSSLGSDTPVLARHSYQSSSCPRRAPSTSFAMCLDHLK